MSDVLKTRSYRPSLQSSHSSLSTDQDVSVFPRNTSDMRYICIFTAVCESTELVEPESVPAEAVLLNTEGSRQRR